MKKITYFLLSFLMISSLSFAQNRQDRENDQTQQERKAGHINVSKFRQLKEELPTPDNQHTASGAPGHEYTQQKVDYTMNIVLDDDTQKIHGDEVITYHNNSKDHLEYLWVQLDQNVRSPNTKSPTEDSGSMRSPMTTADGFGTSYLKKPFQGGINLEYVQDENGKPLSHTVNETMMRINLAKPLAPGAVFKFKIKWWYNINNHVTDGGRSGFEHFEKDGNNAYVIAQFFPRMCVYNNVEGWQNMQFTGRSEFALEFGDYTVNITVPEDHILNATGKLTNEKEVLSAAQYSRLQQAKKSFEDPVIIVTQKEAEAAEKKKAKKTKTWKFFAENVRDYAFATSRKYIWDGMAVDINGKTVMAYSLYAKEGNPLWEKHSTRVVANTLKVYSKYTFDYPYHKAISVHAQRQGMEYPQICFNYGRPNEDGTYSDRVRDGMIGVITHEVGHNFFPMIVNSDERQWTWMDEGINSFVEILAEVAYRPDFNSGNLPKDIVRYMGIDQDRLSPIMSQGDNVFNFGPNAYTKPAAGLYMLRETIMGHDLFDTAFRTYSQRWMFKHPTPADFFRTMEDASGMDLDWFWRGWFYTTDYNDVGIASVKSYYMTDKPSGDATAGIERAKRQAERFGVPFNENELIFFAEGDPSTSPDVKKATDFKFMKDQLKGLSKEEEAAVPNYFYEVTFDKPGGLVLPLIVGLVYEDGTTEIKKYAAQVWNKSDAAVQKVFASAKKITNIVVDPNLETADIDVTNNSWPKSTEGNQFEQFKNKLKN